MNATELEEVYTQLCRGLTSAGESRTPLVLARLVLLLMQQAPCAATVQAAVADALEGVDGDR